MAAAPARSYAARALVEAAVRAWKCKYPTSKVDDCAVVCLFLNSNDLSSASAVKSEEKTVSMGQQVIDDNMKGSSEPLGINRSGTVRNDGEKLGDECKDEEVEADEDDALLYSDPGKDWSALEGVSRVNTLLTLPRFVPGEVDKAAAGAAKTLK